MLETLLGSKTRARILSVLVLEGKHCRLLELQRLVGTSVSSVQKELEKLETIGLVRSNRTSDGRHIEAVRSHPCFEPLRDLLATDAGEGGTTPRAEIRGLNPVVVPLVAEITDACRRHGAVKAALVGSATQPDPAVTPADLDVLVRFVPDPEGYADRYFGLLEELERIMGMPVEIIEEDAVVNPYLAAGFAATQVVLYEAA
jgi:uncharacterized protein